MAEKSGISECIIKMIKILTRGPTIFTELSPNPGAQTHWNPITLGSSWHVAPLSHWMLAQVRAVNHTWSVILVVIVVAVTMMSVCKNMECPMIKCFFLPTGRFTYA